MDNGQLGDTSTRPPVNDRPTIGIESGGYQTPDRDLRRRIIDLSLWTEQMLTTGQPLSTLDRQQRERGATLVTTLSP